MKRLFIGLTFLSLVLATALPMTAAYARTSVGINLRIGDAYRGPRVYFQDEPDVVLVPGTRDVYYIQDSDYDIYQVGGLWYYNYNGDWYRARSYNGPYRFVSYQSVPRRVYMVNTRYRRHWNDYRDVHYGRYRDYNNDRRWRHRHRYDRDRDYDQNRDRDYNRDRGGY